MRLFDLRAQALLHFLNTIFQIRDAGLKMTAFYIFLRLSVQTLSHRDPHTIQMHFHIVYFVIFLKNIFYEPGRRRTAM